MQHILTSGSRGRSGAASVVKLGGSLLASPERDGLLSAAARPGVALVPGGGPFADVVRAEQPRLRFSDAAAHDMAILAMEQTARLIRDLAPEYDACADAAGFDAAREAGHPALWLPAAMADRSGLRASWAVTSDSLALWLARALGATRLILLKSATVEPGSGPEDWRAAGIVDEAFPSLANGFQGEIMALGPATGAALGSLLERPSRIAA